MNELGVLAKEIHPSSSVLPSVNNSNSESQNVHFYQIVNVSNPLNHKNGHRQFYNASSLGSKHKFVCGIRCQTIAFFASCPPII
jgi:hypothetical protein